MGRDQENPRKFRDRLQDRFRLVILDDGDLSELRSYRLSALNIYLLISSFIIILSILLTCLLIFTPLKRYVPGYGDVHSNYEFIELQKEVRDVQENFKAQQTYIMGLKQMISGGEISTPPVGSTEVDLGYNSSAEHNSSDHVEHLFFMPPLRGEISEGFMSDKSHFGLDIIAPKGSAISTISDGVVVSAEWNIDTGYSMTIQHDNDILSVYKHNERLLKKTGEKVKEGESIAIMGNTGLLSSGPHLHFELWAQGVPVNPAKYIDFNH